METKESTLHYLIKCSIEKKMLDGIEDMSLEEKLQRFFVVLNPEVPLSQKELVEAVDRFVEKFEPDNDNAEGLFEYFGICEQDRSPEWLEIMDVIESKTKGNTPTPYIVEAVKKALKRMSPTELMSFCVFGVTVTEEQARQNIKTWADRISNTNAMYLFHYVRWAGKEPIKNKQEAIDYTARGMFKYFQEHFPESEEDLNKLNEYTEVANEVILKYDEEVKAYAKGYTMIKDNDSAEAISYTVKSMLNNG